MNLPDLLRRWDAFDSQQFPSDQTDLRSFETFAAMAYAKLVEGRKLDMRDVQLLWHCQDGLSKALGSLAGPASAYFAELEALVRLAIGQASTDPSVFATVVAVELKELLDRRVRECLSGKADDFPAILVATINLVADVLRGPISLSPDPDKTREALLRSTGEQLRVTVERFTQPAQA
ncbi:hypothetical protein [Gemmata sp.]|uniref:hypothetical protein n=1 Tax=Gemmata sp. TaxID=1914242 RepID=UPI003F700B1D